MKGTEQMKARASRKDAGVVVEIARAALAQGGAK
jgi:hypothetical protein